MCVCVYLFFSFETCRNLRLLHQCNFLFDRMFFIVVGFKQDERGQTANICFNIKIRNLLYTLLICLQVRVQPHVEGRHLVRTTKDSNEVLKSVDTKLHSCNDLKQDDEASIKSCR